MSEIISGKIYSGRRFFDGSIEIQNGKILRLSEQVSGNPNRLILPLIPNCHTHIADYCLRGRVDPNLSLDAIVKPPNGLKHALLSKTDERLIEGGISSALSEMNMNGIGFFADFREGGVKGLEILRRAMTGAKGPRPMILSRPNLLKYSENEIDELLNKSDGIGLSAISDWQFEEMSRISQHVRSRKKKFSLHASETKREDIDKILALEPDFIVHMAHATRDDLTRCIDSNVPIIVCPRSNLLFRIPLDISRMIDLGATVCLGTDNAMFNSLSMIDEMRVAFSLRSNSRQLDAKEIFKLAMDNPQKVINDNNLISISPGNPCNLMVVEGRKEITPESLISTDVAYSIRTISHN